METAAAKMNPELQPIKAVPACKANELPDAASKKKATGVGNRAIVSHPVRAKYNFLQTYGYHRLGSQIQFEINYGDIPCYNVITYVRM